MPGKHKCVTKWVWMASLTAEINLTTQSTLYTCLVLKEFLRQKCNFVVEMLGVNKAASLRGV